MVIAIIKKELGNLKRNKVTSLLRVLWTFVNMLLANTRMRSSALNSLANIHLCLIVLTPLCEELRNDFDFSLEYNHSLRRDDPVSHLNAWVRRAVRSSYKSRYVIRYWKTYCNQQSTVKYKKERINLAPYRLPPSGTGWSHQSCSCKQECVASCQIRVKLRIWFLPELHVPPWTFRPPRLPVGCLWPRVPRRCQRRVDDHVHRNQVGHGVIGSPHCAQDPFTGLLKVQRQLISDGRSGFRAFRCREQVRGRREEQRSTLASAPVCASLGNVPRVMNTPDKIRRAKGYNITRGQSQWLFFWSTSKWVNYMHPKASRELWYLGAGEEFFFKMAQLWCKTIK